MLALHFVLDQRWPVVVNLMKKRHQEILSLVSMTPWHYQESQFKALCMQLFLLKFWEYEIFKCTYLQPSSHSGQLKEKNFCEFKKLI